MVATRAGRLRELSQGELRLYLHLYMLKKLIVFTFNLLFSYKLAITCLPMMKNFFYFTAEVEAIDMTSVTFQLNRKQLS